MTWPPSVARVAFNSSRTVHVFDLFSWNKRGTKKFRPRATRRVARSLLHLAGAPHIPCHLAPAIGRNGDLDDRLSVLEAGAAQAAHVPIGRPPEVDSHGDRLRIGVGQRRPHRRPALGPV